MPKEKGLEGLTCHTFIIIHRCVRKYTSDNLHSRCLERLFLFLLLLLLSQETLGDHLREWRDSSPCLNLGQES